MRLPDASHAYTHDSGSVTNTPRLVQSRKAIRACSPAQSSKALGSLGRISRGSRLQRRIWETMNPTETNLTNNEPGCRALQSKNRDRPTALSAAMHRPALKIACRRTDGVHFWVRPARLSSREPVEWMAVRVSSLDATLFMGHALAEGGKGPVREGAAPRLPRGRRVRAIRQCSTQPFRKYPVDDRRR